jgi:hypothetical protein
MRVHSACALKGKANATNSSIMLGNCFKTIEAFSQLINKG